MTGDVGLAYCYRHPNRETGVRCIRCDRPICPDCMRPASVGFHCPDDTREGARSIRAPRTSIGAKIAESPPYVTVSLVAVNVALYLVTGLQSPGTLRDPGNSPLFVDWQLFPFRVESGSYYQLLTSGFLHFSPIHIAANVLALCIIGPPLERLLGSWRFLALFLISTVGSSALEYAFQSPYTTSAGASGGVFGLFGACLLLARRLQLNFQWLVSAIVINFVFTFAVPGISVWGHIGGFVTGVLCAFALGGSWRSSARIPVRIQVAALTGVVVLIVLVVAIRTATFSYDVIG